VTRAARPLRLRAYAKVNLGLEVLGVRDDGYHELRTIFQTIDLHDDVVLRPRRRGVVVLCDHPGVPRDGSNLAARAAEALLKHAGVAQGVEITLVKRIPVAGGLGGGSSDAAAVLLGLDHRLALGLGPAGLLPLARRLGADVPYFLTGGTALGLARGDEVYPLFHQVRAHVVVVDAGRPVSTAAVFARCDARLTPRENSYTIYRFVSRDLEGSARYAVLTNDLEPAALEEAPELAEQVARIRGLLVGEGALLASLSGSGASFFGLFDAAGRARRAQAVLASAGFRALRAQTLTLGRYRRAWSESLRSARRAR
jgi:4-diphosphocytidyl-2-C-methyl-D-erythritol kinase